MEGGSRHRSHLQTQNEVEGETGAVLQIGRHAPLSQALQHATLGRTGISKEIEEGAAGGTAGTRTGEGTRAHVLCWFFVVVAVVLILYQHYHHHCHQTKTNTKVTTKF